MSAIKPVKEPLSVTHPDLAKEWDYDKNAPLTPNEVLPKSNKKAWWICSAGHKWQAVIASRSAGKGCPYCSGRLTVNGYNDLVTVNPKLASEWNYEKNTNMRPELLSPFSHKKAWWICSKCGNEWSAEIKSRNSGNGCPKCAVESKTKAFINNLISDKGSLAHNNPELASEWHPTRNGNLTPYDVMTGTNRKVWWLGKCGHEWEAVISSRALNNAGCPYCSGRATLTGFNDLVTISPLLASEWNYEKNANLRPDQISPFSHKRAWWVCSKCGNEWSAEIKSRNSGNGCPKCGLLKLSIAQRENNLKEKGSLLQNNPELAKEWHPTKNGKLTPNDVLAGSNIKAWWLGKCGHEWEAVISSRNTGCGCPICGYKQSAITRNKLKIEKGLSLEEVNPKLAKEWHPVKNGNLTPKDVLAGSNNMAWWLCRKGHEWQAVISSRNSGVGCPICTSERKTSFPEQSILYYFSKIYDVKGRYQFRNREIDVFIPELSVGIEYDGRFFHKSENSLLRDKAKMEFLNTHGITLIRIREADYNSVSNNIIYYKYDAHYSELPWAIQAAARLINSNINLDINLERDQNDIYEQYINSEKQNSLVIMYPEIAEEWNYEKNGKIKPETIPFSSNKRFWWKCKKGHEWQAVVSSRSSGTGCPYCSGRKAIPGETDFATVNPILANEWDYERNAPLTPSDVLPQSNKKVGWICSKCGYKWVTQVNHRSRGRNCPQCAKDSQIKNYVNNQIAKSGSLAQNNPKIASQWHPTRNGTLTPNDVLTGTNRKVWWLGECGHEWEAVIASRARNNSGCPFCSGRSGNKIMCIETGRTYLSFSEASSETGINASTISLCCRGKQKTSGGYHWKFVEEK